MAYTDYCYLIGESLSTEDNKWRHPVRCKIGCTSDPRQRRENLRVAQPTWDYLNVWFDLRNGAGIEKNLHAYYRGTPAHIAGEVFDLPVCEVLWLCSLTGEVVGGGYDGDVNFFTLIEFDWRAKWEGVSPMCRDPHQVFWLKMFGPPKPPSGGSVRIIKQGANFPRPREAVTV